MNDTPAIIIFLGTMLLLASCCPFLPPAAYEAAQEDCLDRYEDVARASACVEGVRGLRARLGQ